MKSKTILGADGTTKMRQITVEASVMAIKKRLIELQERIVVRESEAVEND